MRAGGQKGLKQLMRRFIEYKVPAAGLGRLQGRHHTKALPGEQTCRYCRNLPEDRTAPHSFQKHKPSRRFNRNSSRGNRAGSFGSGASNPRAASHRVPASGCKRFTEGKLHFQGNSMLIHMHVTCGRSGGVCKGAPRVGSHGVACPAGSKS